MNKIKINYRGFTIVEYSNDHVIQFYKIRYGILFFPQKYDTLQDCYSIIDLAHYRAEQKRKK